MKTVYLLVWEADQKKTSLTDGLWWCVWLSWGSKMVMSSRLSREQPVIFLIPLYRSLLSTSQLPAHQIGMQYELDLRGGPEEHHQQLLLQVVLPELPQGVEWLLGFLHCCREKLGLFFSSWGLKWFQFFVDFNRGCSLRTAPSVDLISVVTFTLPWDELDII